MQVTTVTMSQRIDPLFLINRSVKQNHPLLAQLVTWRNSVDLFREQEKKDSRNLYNDLDHRSVLSILIGQGEMILCHAKMQELGLEEVGLSFEMVESEIRALRDDLRITHEELISEEETRDILSVFQDAA